MKKILTFAMVAVLALSMAGCGEKEQVSQGTGVVNENGEVVLGTTIDGAGKEVNLDALEGEKLTAVKGDGEEKGNLGDATVSIDDAKIIEYNGEKNIVVTFTYKNKSGELRAFDHGLIVEAAQGEGELMANVVQGVEGINILSAVELIEDGATTTAQKAFRLRDAENAVTITVMNYANPMERITKTFNVK